MTDLTQQLGGSIFSSVIFKQFDHPVFSCQKIGKVVGIWDSDYLDGDDSLVAWKSIVFTCTKPQNSDIYIFISNNDQSNENPVWIGPYRNNETILTPFTKRYMKIRAVLIFSGEYEPGYQYVTNGPSIDSISLQCMTSENSAKFFTKSYDIGFSPKYILLTSEADIPSGSTIRYGVTNVDSTKEEMYQFFEPNQITKLENLPVTGQKIKLYIEMNASAGDPIIIHEFAIMFSDMEQAKYELNR